MEIFDFFWMWVICWDIMYESSDEREPFPAERKAQRNLMMVGRMQHSIVSVVE